MQELSDQITSLTQDYFENFQITCNTKQSCFTIQNNSCFYLQEVVEIAINITEEECQLPIKTMETFNNNFHPAKALLFSNIACTKGLRHILFFSTFFFSLIRTSDTN